MEETERVLGGTVERHIMFVLASLLREGADTFVHPFVAVDLRSLM